MNEHFRHIISAFDLPLHNPVLVFSLILLIILLAPIILKRLNIPGIIGLIISGVLIGPHGFNILEKNSAVDLFSTIGLLYIMFIAGLELDMNEFKVNKYKSLLFGFFTFIIPISIGFPVCHYLLEYDINASILIASMFATHTLIAYPIVSKLGIAKNQAVAITVGGTILTDTAVLIILAIVMGNNHGTLNAEFWATLGISLTVFSLIMFFLVPRITKWFFRKLESEKHAHYIFVLSVVFFAAFLAEMAGVEPIIGAFVAGLTLNPLIPHSSALMNRIEFIGNALFIPFFLISVGMLVDVSVILKGPMAIIIAATLTTVAIIGKWLAALFTQISFKYSRNQRQLIFGLSSSHAAATLAVILVGYKANILDENILNGTIILILITSVVASMSTERASKKIIIAGEETTSSGKSTINNSEHILVPIANSSNIEKLLEFAYLIKDKKSVNPVTLLCVVPNNDEAETNIVETRKKLKEYESHGAATEVKVNTIATIDHNASSGIARTSLEIMADNIVLGWPSKSRIFDKLIGEKIESIINNVDKNLFIAHLDKPLIATHKIILVTPPFAEKEFGFKTWFRKMVILSKELNKPIVHFGNQFTFTAMKEELKKLGIHTTLSHQLFDDWDDFFIIARNITEDDMIVLVNARKGAFSYMSVLEHLPSKIEKFFESNNKMVIFPQQYSHGQAVTEIEDLTHGPITKGIEAIEQIGSEIGNLFKKK